MNAKEIPLSDYALDQLNSDRNNFSISATMISGISVMCILTLATADNGYILLGGTGVILTLWAILWLKKRRTWRSNEANIILQNEVDYNRSLQLKEALQKFETAKASDFSVTEKSVEGEWKPFRVEHFVSNSLRGEIIGDIALHGNILFGGTLRKTMKGTVKGMAIPNLLDSSSMLFLKGPNGTLRVLLPSPRATRELLVETLERWLSETPENSHIYKALREFSVTDDHLLNPISHPQLIDSLDASCEMLANERPNVGVIGERIQAGVVLVTALEVDGTQKIFLPSGFFSKLSEYVAPFLDQIKEPEMLSVVKEG